MNFVAVCSQRRADRAHKLSFGHGEQQFISRSNPAEARAAARRFAVHFIAIKRRPRIDFNQCLEPISKSFEEHNEAGKLDKAEEIVGVVLPTNEDPALPLKPGEEALDEPASHVAA